MLSRSFLSSSETSHLFGTITFRIEKVKFQPHISLDFFETPHNLTAEHLCKMFGLEYSTARNLSETKEKLSTFYNDSQSPKLLEIFTPSDLNDKVLKDYINYLR